MSYRYLFVTNMRAMGNFHDVHLCWIRVISVYIQLEEKKRQIRRQGGHLLRKFAHETANSMPHKTTAAHGRDDVHRASTNNVSQKVGHTLRAAPVRAGQVSPHWACRFPIHLVKSGSSSSQLDDKEAAPSSCVTQHTSGNASDNGRLSLAWRPSPSIQQSSQLGASHNGHLHAAIRNRRCLYQTIYCLSTYLPTYLSTYSSIHKSKQGFSWQQSIRLAKVMLNATSTRYVVVVVVVCFMLV